MNSSPERCSMNFNYSISPIKREFFDDGLDDCCYSPELIEEQLEERHDPFTWIQEFRKECQAKIGRFNLESLVKVMVQYRKLIEPTVNGCYKRPNRAAKLKTILADTLMFFHLTYSNLNFSLGSSAYKEILAELMVMYLDMELKASSTKLESEHKIASQITSSLMIYFGDKSKYALDIMLKARMISRDSSLICGLIFQRLLWDIPKRIFDIFSYLRYLLIFKRWKSIVCSPEEKEMINKLAVQKLKPPLNLKEKIAESSLQSIFPKISKSCTDITAHLMKCKMFSKESVQAFFKAQSACGLAHYDWPTEAVKTFRKESTPELTETNQEEDINYDILSMASIKKMLGEEVKPPYNFNYKRNKKRNIALHKNEVVVVSSDEEDDTSLSFKMIYDYDFWSSIDESSPLISSSQLVEPVNTHLSKKKCMEIDILRDDPDFLNFHAVVDSTCYEEYLNCGPPTVREEFCNPCGSLAQEDSSSRRPNQALDFSAFMERSLGVFTKDNSLDRLSFLCAPPDKDKRVNVVPPLNLEEIKGAKTLTIPEAQLKDASCSDNSPNQDIIPVSSDNVQCNSVASEEEPKRKRPRRTRKRNS